MKKKLIIILCAVLALVLAVAAAAAIYIHHMLGKIQREEPFVPTTTATEEALPTEENAEAATEPSVTDAPSVRDEVLAFLLIGQDHWPEHGNQRSDVMILCTVNKTQKKLTLTSLQRDMRVAIPGYGQDRLNAAYRHGGMALLAQTLQENFGLTLDGMFSVDFDGFTGIVDYFGGVGVTLTQAEADYLKLPVGPQTLSGKNALLYARTRKIDSDFHRTERQRKLIISLLEQNRDMSLAQLHDVMTICLPMLSTDLSNKQIIGYATELLPLLKDLTVESGAIPVQGHYEHAVIAGREVLIVDIDYARAQIQALLEGDS